MKYHEDSTAAPTSITGISCGRRSKPGRVSHRHDCHRAPRRHRSPRHTECLLDTGAAGCQIRCQAPISPIQRHGEEYCATLCVTTHLLHFRSSAPGASSPLLPAGKISSNPVKASSRNNLRPRDLLLPGATATVRLCRSNARPRRLGVNLGRTLLPGSGMADPRA